MEEKLNNVEVVEDATSVQEVSVAEETPVDYEAEYKKAMAENAKLKAATDKACNEAANFKKALREKQSEAERAEAERAEKEAEREAELERYRTEARINAYKSKLVDSGYDVATADMMASKLPAGIEDDFFDAQKAFLANQRKVIESELLNKQPGLTTGKTVNSDDVKRAEIDKLRRSFGLK